MLRKGTVVEDGSGPHGSLTDPHGPSGACV